MHGPCQLFYLGVFAVVSPFQEVTYDFQSKRKVLGRGLNCKSCTLQEVQFTELGTFCSIDELAQFNELAFLWKISQE